MAIIDLATENFQAEITKSDKPVLVDFWAVWCGPCQMMAPILHELEEEVPDVQIGKVNVDEQMELARQQARRLDMDLKEGVYMYFPGPQYETPAEVRMARILGADAVGMSTAPEVITAGHCGMEVLGFTLVSNMAAGVLPKKLSEEEVLEAAAAARDRFSSLVLACLEHLN